MLFLFSNCRSNAPGGGIWFRFAIAHFSASGDSTAFLFIFARRRFEPSNNLYLAVFNAGSGRLFVFVARCCVSYHGYLSFEEASLISFIFAVETIVFDCFS